MTRRSDRLKRLLFLLAVLTAVLGSCAWMVKVRSMSYGDVERIPRPGDHPVAMYPDTSLIDRPFVIIGLVEGDTGDLGSLGQREMEQKMKREVRRMGGDALVNLRRPLSIYSPVRTHDRDVLDRQYPATYPDNGRTYRWVAEVISYDIRTEMMQNP